jgi:micrococcal nuclease
VNRTTLIRWLTVSLIIVILALLGRSVIQQGSLGILPPKGPNRPGYYPVTHVTDGDTFDVRIAGQNEAVRLIGIDTPETHDPRKPVQCYGVAAAEEAHHLLDHQQVRLEGDPTDSDRDKYHRLLRYAYLDNGVFYNQYMVQHGYAFAYTIFPNEKLDQFKQWESEARQQGLGIWSACQVHLDGDIEQTNAVGPAPLAPAGFK